MTGRVLHYFAGDHTAKGFYPLYASNFHGLERVFVLKGPSSTVKSNLLKKIAAEWHNKGYDVEQIHCSADHEALDGVIIPQLSIGLYDGSSHSFVCNASTEKAVNTYEGINEELLKEKIETLVAYKDGIKAAYKNSHEAFKTGLHVHDELEKIYINEMNFDKADQTADELIKKIFKKRKPSGKKGFTKHRFFGASTPSGVVDFIPNLTENLNKRYFIKGRAGTGKSTLLKKVAAEAEERGYIVELYHCGFDPESIDMVIVRELGVCVFDSTDPHEYFPDQESDEIVDLYKQVVTPGTDEKYAEAIQEHTAGYKTWMKKGAAYLKEASQINEKLENMYAEAMDPAVTVNIYKMLTLQLEKQAST
ncbi:PRK06851 family protein [Alteribacillus sp. HJP-4]|uniref:PRK06851 family protein n=1 Tax=Alteribacillus sp. HJP-4 TaxID=2775394 RepID=UPI0035CD0ABF